MHVAIVGAGQAGAAAAAKLRALGHQGAITLLGDEPVAPYQRPPLSKAYLLGQMPLERMTLRGDGFWADQGIALRKGAEVVAIDPAARQLSLADGKVLGWDRLILATGAAVRRLPDAMGGNLAGVHHVRTLADADAMAPEFVADRRVLIVGGGYIGLEAAAVAAAKGLKVTLIEAAPRILQRVASVETADWFRDLHRRHGVEILEGTALSRLTAVNGRVSGADLADGRHIPCDFAIVGVGVSPGVALAEAAGIAIDNGIATDAFGQTSADGIWAAGDCASFPLGDRRIRLESVPNAIEMAETVAANILGAGKEHRPDVWFWSDQHDVKLQIAGLDTGHDQVVVRQVGAARSHWNFAAGRLVSVDAMNDPRAFMIARRVIQGQRAVDPAQVGDPAFDLKSLM